jgi:glycosyltransferase involved in cell wall biosynthesis
VSDCFLIPIYNHHETIQQTVSDLMQFQLPVLIVDDGSDDQTKAALASVVQQYPEVILLTLPENSGKGGAVMAGMLHAYQLGFSHALQVDADGQHNLSDIPALLATSARHPDALISGQPVYDDSIPVSRKIGRYITHFWVWVETLSFDVKDTMCGFRVYPLHSCVDLIQTTRLGQRMDFDIEIMVRLYWRGVNILFVPTKVIYPPGGRSHFHALKDNWLISKMHSRLFFGMLRRLPQLCLRQWRSAE